MLSYVSCLGRDVSYTSRTVIKTTPIAQSFLLSYKMHALGYIFYHRINHTIVIEHKLSICTRPGQSQLPIFDYPPIKMAPCLFILS